MGNRKALIVFVEGLVNVNALHRDIIGKMLSSRQRPARTLPSWFRRGETERDCCARDTSTKILLGKVAIVVDTIPRRGGGVQGVADAGHRGAFCRSA